MCLIVSSAAAANVEWHAPSECAVDQFTTRVELVLGRPLEQVKDHDFRVEVTKETAIKWQLAFTLLTPKGEQGRREINGASCADVTRAGAVAAAMALQAEEASPASEQRTAPPTAADEKLGAAPASTAPTQAPPTQAAPSPATARDPNKPIAAEEPAPSSPFGALIALGLIGDAGLLGKPSLGPELALGLHWSALRFGLSGTWLPTVKHEVAPGRGGEFGLVAADVWACARSEGDRWLLFACAHYEVGSLSGRGSGDQVTESWSRSALWQAVRPDLGFALPFGKGFEAQARFGVSIALRRPEFVLDEELVALKPERLTARGVIGIAYTP